LRAMFLKDRISTAAGSTPATTTSIRVGQLAI
jgi:hypothetical protein